MCVIFGVAIVRQHDAFQRYRAATLEAGPLPWAGEAMEPEACVSFATEWAMACPGLGTWCESEAPRLVMQCMASRDRTLFCTATGDATGSTEFGYDDCARLREDVDGTYAKRSHKKFCGAAFRAVAEHCRRGGAVP